MKRVIIVATLDESNDAACVEDVADLVSLMRSPRGRSLDDVTIYLNASDLVADLEKGHERLAWDLTNEEDGAYPAEQPESVEAHRISVEAIRSLARKEAP